MLRGVDHIVLAVEDIAAARDLFASIGFTVSPTAFHPFGTKNALVQLDGSYLELLAVHDEAKILQQKAEPSHSFSFARFNLDFLRERQGASMMVLGSQDVESDLADFNVLGLETFPRIDFQRDVEQPDGSVGQLSFSNGFLSHPLMRGTGFFVCHHQHPPDDFWQKNYQTHKNGAHALKSVVFASPNPSDHHEFLGGFSGQRVMRSTSAGVEMDIKDGQIEVLTPAAAKAFYTLDVPAGFPDEGGILALEISADLDATERALSASDVSFARRADHIVVKPADLCGVGLIFTSLKG